VPSSILPSAKKQPVAASSRQVPGFKLRVIETILSNISICNEMKKTSFTTITGHHEYSDEFPKYCSVKHIYVRRWEASDEMHQKEKTYSVS